MEVDPTMPKDLDFHGVRRELLRYERMVDRRVRKHAKQSTSVDQQVVAVESAQAELVKRRAAADETQAQIKGYRDTIATLTARQGALATACPHGRCRH